MKDTRYFVVDNGSIKALRLRQKLIKILRDWKFDSRNPHYIFILGGDGTSIQNAIRFNNADVKLIVIKAGNFGFFASFDDHNLPSLLNEIQNELNYRHVHLLQVQWNKNMVTAFNDVVLNSPAANKINLFVNDVYFETCWNSGFIFTTPLGSTGINKSAHGPIISPLVDCWGLMEVNPISHATFFTLTNAMILPTTATITLKGSNGIKFNYSLIIDGINQGEQFCEKALQIRCILSHVEFFFSWKLEDYIHKIQRFYVRN